MGLRPPSLDDPGVLHGAFWAGEQSSPGTRDAIRQLFETDEGGEEEEEEGEEEEGEEGDDEDEDDTEEERYSKASAAVAVAIAEARSGPQQWSPCGSETTSSPSGSI